MSPEKGDRLMPVSAGAEAGEESETEGGMSAEAEMRCDGKVLPASRSLPPRIGPRPRTVEPRRGER